MEVVRNIRRAALHLLVGCAFLLGGRSARAADGAAAPPANAGAHIDELSVDSKLLKAKKSLVIYLPPGYDGSGKTRYPVLYYLHGLNNNAHRFVDEKIPDITDKLIHDGNVKPLIIVSPTGDYSFYVNKPDGSAPYEDYITQEVREYVEGHYPVDSSDAAERGIGGVSMGGYGALKIAMKDPKLYGSVSAHTPFVISKIPEAGRTDRRSQQFMQVVTRTFGDPIDMKAWADNDPFELAKRGGFDGLAIFIDSASKDRYFLNVEANALHKELVGLNIKHQFVPIDDVHGWVSLRNNWEEILKFHEKTFAAKTTQPAGK